MVTPRVRRTAATGITTYVVRDGKLVSGVSAASGEKARLKTEFRDEAITKTREQMRRARKLGMV